MKDLFSKKNEYPTFNEIIEQYSKEASNYLPKSGNVFGFWMQTLADIQFLDLELSGLTDNFKIDALKYKVYFNNHTENIRKRIAHLNLVNDKPTLYSYLIDLFGDTNAYAFHNLYPYIRTVFNPLLGSRNRAIRGESYLLYYKWRVYMKRNLICTKLKKFRILMISECEEKILKETVTYILNKYHNIFDVTLLPSNKNKESYITDVLQFLCATEP